jgi:MOSC domain-containing protein YiiM
VRTFDELERLWAASPPPPATRGTVRLLCVRTAPGEHACPPTGTRSAERGIEGDRWWSGATRDPESQVTLMSARVAELVAAEHAPLHAAGDNILVDLALDEASLPAGTRLRVGSAILEVSEKPHTGCKKFRERFGVDAMRWVNEHRERRLRGVNCRVAVDGQVVVGDAVEVLGR